MRVLGVIFVPFLEKVTCKKKHIGMCNWPAATLPRYCKIQLHLIEELQSANFPRVKHCSQAAPVEGMQK